MIKSEVIGGPGLDEHGRFWMLGDRPIDRDVYPATGDDGQQVAVKFLSRDFADPNSAALFRQESSIPSMLGADSVQVYDRGQTEDGDLYYVMELLDGDSLYKAELKSPAATRADRRTIGPVQFWRDRLCVVGA